MLPPHLEVGEEVVGVAGVPGQDQDLQVLLPHPGFPIDDIVYSDEKKDLCNTRVFGSATDVSQIYLRSWFSRRSSSSSSSSSRSSRLNAGVEFFFLNLLHLFFFLNVASGQLQGGTHQDGK